MTGARSQSSPDDPSAFQRQFVEANGIRKKGMFAPALDALDTAIESLSGARRGL